MCIRDRIQLVVKDPTVYVRGLNLEKSQEGEFLVPCNSIIAVGDFVVVSEEDIV